MLLGKISHILLTQRIYSLGAIKNISKFYFTSLILEISFIMQKANPWCTFYGFVANTWKFLWWIVTYFHYWVVRQKRRLSSWTSRKAFHEVYLLCYSRFTKFTMVYLYLGAVRKLRCYKGSHYDSRLFLWKKLWSSNKAMNFFHNFFTYFI